MKTPAWMPPAVHYTPGGRDPLYMHYEHMIPRSHYEGMDNRLGDRIVLKLPNNELSKWQHLAQAVPHTSCWWIDYVSAGRGVTSAPDWAAIIWNRRHRIEQLTDAIATVSMLTDKTIIMLRSFSAPLHRSDYK